jgi:endonuclease/exonuclease/phosphatase family metal-dependent hydrolase
MAPWLSASDATAHVKAVAQVVAALDADIVALAEVEGCFMLRRLAQALPAAAGYTPLLVPGTDSATRQQMGLLSRLSPLTGMALQRSENRCGFPSPLSGCGFTGRPKTTGVSKHFFTVFAVPGLGRELLVVGAHLKARPNEPRSCAQREGQAQVLADLVREHALDRVPRRHVILLGDLNDFDAATLDAAGSSPRSTVLRSLTEGLGLRSAAERLPQHERWTWQGSRHPRAALDHILLSEELFSRLDDVQVGTSAEVDGDAASDHRPLLVSLRLNSSSATSEQRAGLVQQSERELRRRMKTDDTHTPIHGLSVAEQSNVVWTSPQWNDDGSGAMPLGNGDITVAAWVSSVTGDLRLVIGKSDALDENSQAVKVGIVRVAIDPPLWVAPPPPSPPQPPQPACPTRTSYTFYRHMIPVDRRNFTTWLHNQSGRTMRCAHVSGLRSWMRGVSSYSILERASSTPRHGCSSISSRWVSSSILVSQCTLRSAAVRNPHCLQLMNA